MKNQADNKVIIRDVLKSTMADDDQKGNRVFEIIKDKADNGCESVTLDFSGIELVNTAFLNNAVGKLFDAEQFDITKCNVTVGGMDDTMIDLLKEAIRVARQKYLRV
ncbi:MAG: STAS-like domain-containing protein [Lachnospiraceae bacterium]